MDFWAPDPLRGHPFETPLPHNLNAILTSCLWPSCYLTLTFCMCLRASQYHPFHCMDSAFCLLSYFAHPPFRALPLLLVSMGFLLHILCPSSYFLIPPRTSFPRHLPLYMSSQ